MMEVMPEFESKTVRKLRWDASPAFAKMLIGSVIAGPDGQPVRVTSVADGPDGTVATFESADGEPVAPGRWLFETYETNDFEAIGFMTETVFDELYDEYKRHDACNAIAALSDALERIPADYRRDAWLEMSGNCGPAIITMKYRRPETPEEYRTRTQAKTREIAELEERERAEYRRLAQKFKDSVNDTISIIKPLLQTHP